MKHKTPINCIAKSEHQNLNRLKSIIIKSRQPRGFADLIQMVIGCQVP